jgi:hypothetical protein
MKEQFQIDQKNDSREERREFLYGKIEKKVNTILDLREFVQENEDMSAQELQILMNKKMQQIMTDMYNGGVISKEDMGRVVDSLTLFSERKQIYKKCLEIEIRYRKECADDRAAIFELGQDSEYVALKKRELEIDESFRELNKNDDVHFFNNIYSFADNIMEKRAFVEIFEQKHASNNKDINVFVKKITGVDLDRAKSANISFKGYNIVIELSPSDYARELDSDFSNANYFRGSAIIVIKDKEGKEATLNHERNHSLSESFIESSRYEQHLIEEVKIDLEVLDAYKRENPPKQEAIDSIKAKIGETIKAYVFENFSEIIADVDRMADRQISTYLKNFLDAIRGLEALAEKQEDGEIRAMLERDLKIAGDDYCEYLHRLSNIFFIAKEMGEPDQAKGALILFKHNQIAKVEKYLKHRFGQEQYERYERLQALVCGGPFFDDIQGLDIVETDGLEAEAKAKGETEKPQTSAVHELITRIKARSGLSPFFSSANLFRLKELLQDGEFQMKEEDKEEILDNLDYVNWSEVVTLGAIRFDELAALDKHLKEIATLLGIEELGTVVEQGLGKGVIMSALSDASGDKFDRLQALYDNWPFDKREFPSLFTQALFDSSVQNGSFILDKRNVMYFMEKIKASPDLVFQVKRMSEY